MASVVASIATIDKEEIRSKKENERIELGENVYSLLVVAPVKSWPFIFSISVMCIKFIVIGILITDISFADVEAPKLKVSVVKFFLVPVAIAMQEDLMSSFSTLANGMYCPSLQTKSTSATRPKLYFGYILRTIDGLLSLYVNYAVMLITNDTISVFLNFAALQFIYDIDDVFYELIALGFFGDQMEHMTLVCKECSLARRYGQWNPYIFCVRISWLDTMLFFFLLIVLYIVYIVWTIHLYDYL
mmetsp:Transcript_9086/g.18860  ORF Transcript_9086/g.18860 Transcript_9086/m.18860 type:complete len:244 (-) Transcript_9086:1474-2205(-)